MLKDESEKFPKYLEYIAADQPCGAELLEAIAISAVMRTDQTDVMEGTMGILRIAVMMLMSWAGCSASSAGELTDRNQIVGECNSHLSLGRFDKLEEQIERYRVNQERTTSGVWKLAICYLGIQNHHTSSREKHNAERWNRYYAQLDKWREQVPESAAARLVEAMYMIEESREIHRSKLDSKNPVAMVRIAADRMKEARSHLLEIKKIASHDPHWYSLMGQTGLFLGQSRNEFFLMMEEGYDRHPKYLELYHNAIRYINNYWPNDDALYEAIANSAQARTEASEGMALYARVYWLAYNHRDQLRLASRSAPHWDKMKKGMDDVLKKYPDEWNIQNFAFFACIVRDKKKTKELLELLESPPILEAWRHPEAFGHCRSLANEAS